MIEQSTIPSAFLNDIDKDMSDNTDNCLTALSTSQLKIKRSNSKAGYGEKNVENAQKVIAGNITSVTGLVVEDIEKSNQSDLIEEMKANIEDLTIPPMSCSIKETTMNFGISKDMGKMGQKVKKEKDISGIPEVVKVENMKAEDAITEVPNESPIMIMEMESHDLGLIKPEYKIKDEVFKDPWMDVKDEPVEEHKTVDAEGFGPGAVYSIESESKPVSQQRTESLPGELDVSGFYNILNLEFPVFQNLDRDPSSLETHEIFRVSKKPLHLSGESESSSSGGREERLSDADGARDLDPTWNVLGGSSNPALNTVNLPFVNRFKCSVCQKLFDTKADLQTHAQKAHTKTKLFQCPYCDHRASRRDRMKSHVKIHTEPKIFECPTCDYKAKKRRVMRIHMLVHNETKRYRCSECHYSAHKKSSLTTHMLAHKNIKVLQCSECDFKTNHKSSLKTHVYIHSDIKLFQCNECNYKTNRKTVLNCHLLNHRNIKLYKCSECDFGTNRRSAFQSHSLTHREFKLFKCSICDFETNFKHHLKLHTNRHYGIKLFKCTECRFETNWKCKLRDHQLKHKSKKETPEF